MVIMKTLRLADVLLDGGIGWSQLNRRLHHESQPRGEARLLNYS
jgi:hypothetical protein